MGFGGEVDAPTRRFPDRQMARHRLHLQCPFRLDSQTAVLTTAADIYRSATAPDSYEAFNWDIRGANIFDVAVAAFWAEHEPGSLVVEDLKADTYGGLELLLSNGYAIRVFPNRSGISEHWRYFLADEGPHFVVLDSRPE